MTDTDRRGLVRAGGVFGLVGVAGLVAVMIVLTATSADFLHETGWSPIRRTPTEWPSLLALGPHGFALNVAFVVGSLSTLALAVATRFSGLPGHRVAPWGLGLVSLGMAGVVFNADLPGVPEESWHARIHNGLYPLILVGFIVACVSVSFGRRAGTSRYAISQRSAKMQLVVVLVGIALTTIPEIAQLVRYFIFGTMLLWVAMVSRSCIRGAEDWA